MPPGCPEDGEEIAEFTAFPAGAEPKTLSEHDATPIINALGRCRMPRAMARFLCWSRGGVRGLTFNDAIQQTGLRRSAEFKR